MRRVRVAVVTGLLGMTAACGPQGGDEGRVAVATGASVESLSEPTTTLPTTTVPRTTIPSTTQPAPATTTAPPAGRPLGGSPIPTTVARPATTTSTTIDAPAATGTAATVTLRAKPLDGIPGFRVTIEVTTIDLVQTVKYDFGNGRIVETTPWDGPTCSRQPRLVSNWDNVVYPASGTYRIRATATIVPCLILDGPPGSPPGVPSPDADPVVVEASILVTR